jgi:hypothetical protein
MVTGLIFASGISYVAILKLADVFIQIPHPHVGFKFCRWLQLGHHANSESSMPELRKE